jgi:hypothetical protein
MAPHGTFQRYAETRGRNHGALEYYIRLITFSVYLGTMFAASANDESERLIRSIVEQAISHINKGELAAFDDFWDEGADYVNQPTMMS